MKNMIMIFLCFTLVIGLQGFATPPPMSTSQTTERVLVYALPYDFTEYSYWTLDSYATGQWTSAVYSGLYIRTSPSHEWIPDLAADFPTNTVNGTEFTVTLKSGLLFPSGNPITADDVIFSYEVALTPEINQATYGQISAYLTKSSLVKIDNSTVKFVFNKPYGFALSILSSPIIEKAIFETRYNDCLGGISSACNWNDPTGADALGAGPFMVESIDNVNDVVTLTKNPNYWNGSNVGVDKIIFKKIADKASAVSALVSGEIDLLDSQYVPAADEFNSLSGIHSEIIGGFAHHELALNHKSPWWGTGTSVPDGNSSDDAMDALLIRRAMSHIIDRNYIVDSIMGGLAVPATSTMPPASVGWDSSLQPDEYNITLAKELMTQAGFDYSTLTDSDNDGVYETFFFELTVLSPNTNQARNQWASLFVSELPKIGIGVKQYLSTGWGEIIPRTFGATSPPGLYDEGGYDLFYVSYSWGFDWDPTGLYEQSSFLPNGGNFYNYVNQTLEQLILDYTSETNASARIEKSKLVQKAIHDDLPVIPIIYLADHWAWDENVTGLDPVLLSAMQQNWGAVSTLDAGTPVTTSTTVGPTATSTTTITTSSSSQTTTTVEPTTTVSPTPTVSPSPTNTTTTITTTITKTSNLTASSSPQSSLPPTDEQTSTPGFELGLPYGMLISGMAIALISFMYRRRRNISK